MSAGASAAAAGNSTPIIFLPLLIAYFIFSLCYSFCIAYVCFRKARKARRKW
jgi:hypothetical protein